MIRWYWAAAAVICAGLGFWTAPTYWAAACWFVGGMCWESFLQGVRAARRVRADQAIKEADKMGEAWRRANECNCDARGGHPHEPDCVWWDRRDLKEARKRGE